MNPQLDLSLPSRSQVLTAPSLPVPRPQPFQLHPVLWYARPSETFTWIIDAWRGAFPNDPLLDFDSGAEVLQFLWNPIALKPRVIVLDANAPYPSGLHILQAIRANPSLKGLPVAVVTRAISLSYMEEAYALGADWCFVAPEDAEQATFFADLACKRFQEGRDKMSATALAA
jgi:CheY-like chemotaxis protein